MSSTADAPYRVREIDLALTSRGLTLPEPVTAAIAAHRRVAATTPTPPPPSALRDAIIAGADDSELASALLMDLGGARLAAAWASAANHTAAEALAQVTTHRDEIHGTLAPLAADCITKLTAVANLGTTTLDTLVREGRHTEAKAYADRDTVAAELGNLYRIRDTYLMPPGVTKPGVGHFNCSRFRNAPDITNRTPNTTTLTDGLIAGIQAGGELWYPTADEAIAVAQRHWDDYAATETERRKEQFGIGSTVFLG